MKYETFTQTRFGFTQPKWVKVHENHQMLVLLPIYGNQPDMDSLTLATKIIALICGHLLHI